MKILIFDSGPLINLAMNGLLYVLENLKKDFNGKFIITHPVKYEVFDRPVGIPRFELGAMQIQGLIEKGVLELPESLGISETDIKKETIELLDIANHFMQIKGEWVQLVSEAEISCLALSNQLSKKGMETMIAVDERTTRMLSESPRNLERVMSEKLHARVEIVAKEFNIFSNFKIIRSPEIVYAAYKKGLLGIEGKKALEAALYATKFKGSAISFEEINELKRL